ncbi:MAG: hypothetical protein H7Y18_03470 [Clostridiaceae bacterium]|nr:hypothetical protein [Clostridiaceae bacterium]
MANYNVKKFSKEKNWTISKNCAYGEIDGYLITLMSISNSKCFFIPLISMEEMDKQAILNSLNENKKMFKLLAFGFSDDTLYFKFTEGLMGAKVKHIDNTLQSITDILKNINFKDKNCCVFCKKEDALEKTYIDSVCFHSHDSCYFEATKELEQAVREYSVESKNYFLGSIGALLGALVCSLPWILAQVFLERIMVLLAFFITLGALKGYTLFKGKTGVLTRWIVALVSLISVVIANITTLIIQLVQHNIPIDSATLEFILDNQELMDTVKSDMLMGLFIASIGIFAMVLQVKGKASDVLPTIKNNLSN